jgi:hypothetical protein
MEPEMTSRLYRVSFGDEGSSLQPEDFTVTMMEPHDIFWKPTTAVSHVQARTAMDAATSEMETEGNEQSIARL